MRQSLGSSAWPSGSAIHSIGSQSVLARPIRRRASVAEERFQALAPLGVGTVGEVLAVEVQDIEGKELERQRLTQLFDAVLAFPCAGDLKRMILTRCRIVGDRFPIQDDGPAARLRDQPLGQLREHRGGVFEVAGEDSHLVARQEVELGTQAVYLRLDGALLHLGDDLLRPREPLGRRRTHRPTGRHFDRGQPGLALVPIGAGDETEIGADVIGALDRLACRFGFGASEREGIHHGRVADPEAQPAQRNTGEVLGLARARLAQQPGQ